MTGHGDACASTTWWTRALRLTRSLRTCSSGEGTACEPLNDTDRIIQTAAANRHRLIVPFTREDTSALQEALVGTWDIVLDEG